MVHIKDKLAESISKKKPAFSFEFYPPKTGQGVQNLYDRMDRMHSLGPEFIDITWNAGGRLSSLTTEMVNVAQSVYGLETCMHLTCTGMPKEKVDEALEAAYKAGCQNILALRGDPPREKEKWEADPNGFRYAKDLVKYIREKYGDHFDIGVAGYPEGCDDGTEPELLMQHLKEKIDAGGTFVITQMFYDVDIFLDWVQKARDIGITVPIIPGIMPIHTYAAFLRRANWTKCRIPPRWLELLEPIKNDDVAVRDIGRDLIVEMCRRILDAGIYQLHFYTMNLATATRMVLEGLDLIPSLEENLPPLPFRPSLGFNRKTETVRPIFWKHRKASYVQRTAEWDEFPNGRWGDSRSPAFGDLDAYGIGLRGSNENNIKLYGTPASIKDVANTFVKYITGELQTLPWSESGITAEVNSIKDELIELNKRGFLTINSQPSINGVKSSHPVYGWGPAGGYVYQKSYLELFVSPEVLTDLITAIERDPMMTYYAVNKQGHLKTNAPEGPNAVTWGVYPGKEIIQPTIVETISFLAWKEEAFKLGNDWAGCYDQTSTGRHVIKSLMEGWWLINIVDNDFHREKKIFELFEGLNVPNLDEPIKIPDIVADLKNLDVSGDAKTNGTNGVPAN
ncbi:methylenetetrahydrofolate reduct [Ascodesmis nigricans]|uniref:Methylenetetrahydrofolate reduct n=1 Tax=Ascodesmis nigricans TaxID=341454 RepID=A0A4S2N8P3_9PEZI|nr:methylenetetrahydrofolate reduct [Ascodesmis nigricans]